MRMKKNYMTIHEDVVEVKLFNRARMEELKLIENEDTEYTFHYASTGACAFDLYAVLPQDSIELYTGQPMISIPTGIGIQINHAYLKFGLLMIIRSGMSSHGIQLVNQIGLIDTDYQGEIYCRVTNNDKEHRPYTINAGDRLAQAWIFPSWKLSKGKIVTEFSYETERADNGFGSTGKNNA